MLNEAIEQQGELLWTFRELRNLVLPEYLNARDYVLWEEVEHGAGLVFHERRVRNSPLDRITALRWSRRPDQQRYLRPTSQYVPDYPFVCLARIISKRFKPEDVPQALDHRGFAGSAATDKHVEIFVQMNRALVEKAPLPTHCKKFGVRFWRYVRMQPDARLGV